MSLDTIGDAQKITSSMTTQLSALSNAGNAMLIVIAQVIDAGFQLATPSLGNLDITPPTGTLVFPLVSGNNMPDVIGQACADYWMLATGKGIPEINVITSVTNDAGKIAAPIAANIRAIPGRGYLSPSYFEFVDAIHKEVLTIAWVIKETNGTTSYNVVVS